MKSQAKDHNPIIEFLPIAAFLLFLITKDIYWATGALMIGTFLQTILHYFFYREFKKNHVFGFVIALLFGAMTLLLHDPMFIKWKFSILHWGLALFLLWRFKTNKTNPIKELFEMINKASISAPDGLYKHLTLTWFIALVLQGVLNLVLAYIIFPDNDKAWGIAKFILVFVGMLASTLYTILKLQPYIPEQPQLSEKE